MKKRILPIWRSMTFLLEKPNLHSWIHIVLLRMTKSIVLGKSVGFVWAKSRVASWLYDLRTDAAPFEFLELGVGENGVSTMSRKTTFTDKPIGKLTRVKDFLPPPSQLVPREETVKVTLALSKESVEFFKEKAKKNKVPYQRMIRSLVDQYVGQHT